MSSDGEIADAAIEAIAERIPLTSVRKRKLKAILALEIANARNDVRQYERKRALREKSENE